MKCPKCGYTSFESYDSCRRCSADLVEFKQSHGLTALVLPPALRASMAAEQGTSQTEEETTAEGGGDMFSFDLPTDQQQTASATGAASDPFSFDDTPAPAAPSFSFDTPAVPAQDDPFAALLETSPHPQDKQSANAPAAPPAAAAPAADLELNSFSWDDTPTPGQPGSTPAGANPPADDDFNSLFGDLGGSDKK